MKRSQQLYLEDIVAAINSIEQFIKGINFQTFCRDDKTTSAVVRKFEIIGEASKKLEAKIRKNYPEVAWKEIAGFRDKLIHDYFGIDYELVWTTIQEKLPEFKLVIRKILKEL